MLKKIKFKKLLCVVLVGLSLASCANKLTTDLPEEEIKRIASQVTAGEVTVYGYDGCPYCTQAKQWLNENNITYTYCNTEKELQCSEEFKAAGGQSVPFTVIKRGGREHIIAPGFDPTTFLQTLSATKK